MDLLFVLDESFALFQCFLGKILSISKQCSLSSHWQWNICCLFDQGVWMEFNRGECNVNTSHYTFIPRVDILAIRSHLGCGGFWRMSVETQIHIHTHTCWKQCMCMCLSTIVCMCLICDVFLIEGGVKGSCFLFHTMWMRYGLRHSLVFRQLT